MIKVNHVLSKNVYSNIFEAIFGYFEKYSCDTKVKHFFTIHPMPDMNVYHYHRPNIEEHILSNSFTTVHHDLNDTDPWLHIDKFINSYKSMKKVICLNETQKKILNQHNINNTIVIPWGYNPNIFKFDAKSCSLPRQDQKICLGIVSKRYGRKVKGEALLYEIVKRLPSDYFKFILVGEGRTQDAYYLSKLGFETRTYEYLPYRLFNVLYSEIDALLITSFYEGGPANVPEAFAKGVPIISTPVGFAKDYICHQDNGIILKKEPINDSQEILRLLDHQYFLKLKQNAMLMREKIMTWQEVVECYNQQYLKSNI